MRRSGCSSTSPRSAPPPSHSCTTLHERPPLPHHHRWEGDRPDDRGARPTARRSRPPGRPLPWTQGQGGTGTQEATQPQRVTVTAVENGRSTAPAAQNEISPSVSRATGPASTAPTGRGLRRLGCISLRTEEGPANRDGRPEARRRAHARQDRDDGPSGQVLRHLLRERPRQPHSGVPPERLVHHRLNPPHRTRTRRQPRWERTGEEWTRKSKSLPGTGPWSDPSPCDVRTHTQQTPRQVRSSWSAMMSVSYWSMICCGVRPVWWARSLMAVVAQFATDSARAINWSSP